VVTAKRGEDLHRSGEVQGCYSQPPPSWKNTGLWDLKKGRKRITVFLQHIIGKGGEPKGRGNERNRVEQHV